MIFNLQKFKTNLKKVFHQRKSQKEKIKSSMVVVKGGGQTYQIGNGKYVPSEEELPQWFKDNLDMQQTNCNGSQKCVEMKDIAQKCMQEKGSYVDCAPLVDAYHLCYANMLQSKLPMNEQVKLKEQQALALQQQYSNNNNSAKQ